MINVNIIHLSVRLITFIQASQAISDEPYARYWPGCIKSIYMLVITEVELHKK